MISLKQQIQSMLDAVGVHLDGDSFANLCRVLRVDRLSWMQQLAVAVGLGVFVAILRKNAEASAAKAAQLSVTEAL